MKDTLQTMLTHGLQDISVAQDLPSLEKIKVAYFGRKGYITGLMQQLKTVSAEQKPLFGQEINSVKNELQQAFAERKQQLSGSLATADVGEYIDISLPGRNYANGKLHPVMQTQQRVVNFFQRLGFECADGPEIETQDYNFTALNMPEHHPARAMQDTFYFPDGRLLRTHTSPVQIRSMQRMSPPMRLISPGKVYRCDSDVTHTPMFHQVEGFMVDEECSFAQLKGILSDFLQYFFVKELAVRFRPAYFPFTEPSAEVDMQCYSCMGEGCRICKKTGWLEILGCGMVHPNVLAYCNIDAEKYNAWAFGVGVDRLTMLYYQIPDLRMLFENDLRFLQQF